MSEQEKIENDVRFFEKNIPPDDIYCFAATTFSMASEILRCWQQHGDLEVHLRNNPVLGKCIINISKMQIIKDNNIDFQLNFGSLFDEDNYTR
jgi:hypothetical protein